MLKSLLCLSVIAVVLCYFALPAEGAGTCYYSVSHISSYRRYVRTYYSYYRYYYYRCGWWGWRRCRGSYRVYVYYTYSYTSYTIGYHSQSYCCSGYSGSNCNPVCYNNCGRCTTCVSPNNCHCQAGWTGSTCCSDLNECSNRNGGCEQNCQNTVGSFYCTCNSGYNRSPDGLHCTDVNECSSNNGGCNQHCKNTAGSYYCYCNSGYQLSGGHTCTDINECNSNNGGCSQNCINQAGTYHCTCNTGYTLSTDLRSCIDNNECTNGAAGCNHYCLNTPGSYNCYCQNGYELAAAGDSDTCVDTQECLSDNGGCDHICTNSIGSYQCSCRNGYNLTADGHTCVDFDECANDAHICEHHCYNNIGSYTCGCRIGYLLDANGGDCHDINECATDNGGCEHNCTNTIGSYNCSCQIGWLLDEDLHNCSDHDECHTNVHDCDENGVCHNTHGTYYCTCNIGFRLDEDGRTCNDIDECAEHSSGCTQICVNTFGSYYCTCFNGFELTSNQHNCTDINECTRDTDGCDKYCHNLIGSYFCSCQIGYQIAPDAHTCVGQPCVPQIPSLANGQVSCTGDQVTDQNCTFSCSPGFELTGSSFRQCLLTNSWTGTDAACNILQCPPLDAPANGYIWTEPCGSNFMDRCEIRCVDGYYINDTTPYYQTCIVDASTNEVYWSSPPECSYIPPCSSNPCRNNGKCIELSPTKYYCDCSETHFTGDNCEIGRIDTPSLPIVTIDEPYEYTLTATPENNIVLAISVSSPSLTVSPNSILFNATHQSHPVQFSSSIPGIYSISYSVSGGDASNFEVPQPSIVIIRDPASTHTDNQYFTTTNQPVGQLSPGCCTPGGQIYQCPYSTNTVTFQSTCSWAVEEQGVHETLGIVYASGSGISLPFSIAGVELTLKNGDISYILPDDGGNCNDCGGSPDTCYHYELTAEDLIDFLETNSLAKTYLSQAEDILPDWISFLISDTLNVTNRRFSTGDFTVSVTTGAKAHVVSGCSSLSLNPDGLYSILSYAETITGTVSGVTRSYDDMEPVCFAIDLCAGTDSPVHISIPNAVQDTVLSLGQFQDMVDSGWMFTLHESMLKSTGLTPPNSIPSDYWVGGSSVSSSSVLPTFDLGLELDAMKYFYDQPNVGVKFIFSGNMYQNSRPSGTEIQGLLDGDVTVVVNTTINQMAANMTLITTSSPVLYTFPDQSSGSSLIGSGAAMKLNMFSQHFDKVFKNILPFPKGAGTCPMDAFVRLTSTNSIDNVLLTTTCNGLSFLGYSLDPGSVRSTLYISGASRPSTTPTYPSANLVVQSDVLSATNRLQLNDFVIISQPTSGPAITIGYTDSSMSGSIPQADFSILGTHFTVPLTFDNTGFTFQTTAQLYGQYTTDISCSLPAGKSWTDFSLNVNGQFSTATGGFVRSLEDYVYSYVQEKIDQSQSRITTASLAVNRSLDAIANFHPIVSSKQNNFQMINQKYQAAQNAFSAANASYHQASSAVNNMGPLGWSIYSDLMSICTDSSCTKECLHTSKCAAIDATPMLNQHGIAMETSPEQLLQHKTVTSSRERWTSDHICRRLTNIKAWAQIGYGQECGYNYIYEMSDETYRQAYHTSVNVSRSMASVMDGQQCSISRPTCITNDCTARVYSQQCMYQSSGCSVARSMVTNNLNETELEAIEPVLTLMEAKENLTVATNQLAMLKYMSDSAKQDMDDSNAAYQKLQNQHSLAQSALSSITDDESNTVSLNQYLQGTTIQSLFAINTISFQTTITNASPLTLPITIYYSLTGLGTNYQVMADAQFTASPKVLKRELSKVVLDNMGGVVQQHLGRKREAMLPTFNERQFEERCAMINSVKNYLKQVYDTLSKVNSTITMAKTNLSMMVDSLTDVINYMPTDYPNINFTVLANQFNMIMTVDQINTLVQDTSRVMKFKQEVDSIKTYTQTMWGGIEGVSLTNWQVGLQCSHQLNRIGSIANQKCYSFSDCLNTAIVIIKEVLQDTPSTTPQMLQNITVAQTQLLSLALDTSVNMDAILSQGLAIMDVINNLLSSSYWCAGLPTMTDSLTPSVHVQVGDPIAIMCDASSPLPVTYSWKKDGYIVPGQTQKTFTITSANEQDEGQYQCLATNAVGTVESTFANVVIYISPVITLDPVDYETYEGSDNGGYFVCNSTGHPIPSFQWYFRKDSQSPWTMVANDSNVLVIDKPTRSNEGWYRCHVSAAIGQAMSKPAHLSILSVNTSTLVYSVAFNMNITDTINDTSINPPDAITTIDYFRDELTLGNATVDHLQIGFSVDGMSLIVRIILSAYYEYRATEAMEMQVVTARYYQNDLLNALNQLEHKVQDEIFWFEHANKYYKTIHQSASVANLKYWCPDGTSLKYGNFLCVTCSPGTYFMAVNGSGMCAACPMNTYQENDGSGSCESCPLYSQTMSTGSRWSTDCIGYCRPGFNSTTGLEPCSPCPQCHFNEDHKQTMCAKCTNEHVNNGTAGCLQNCTYTAPTSSGLPVYIPAAAAGGGALLIIGLVILLVIIILVAVFVTKSRAKKESNQDDYRPTIVTNQSRASIAVPNDILSLVPESEQVAPQTVKYSLKGQEPIEHEDREVVNPLFSEANRDESYESLSRHQVVNELTKEKDVPAYDEVPREDIDESPYDTIPHDKKMEDKMPELKGIGGLASRKAALFGR